MGDLAEKIREVMPGGLRRKIMRLPPEFLFRELTAETIKRNLVMTLPRDLRLVYWYVEKDHSFEICFVVESDEFELIPPGQPYPVMESLKYTEIK